MITNLEQSMAIPWCAAANSMASRSARIHQLVSEPLRSSVAVCSSDLEIRHPHQRIQLRDQRQASQRDQDLQQTIHLQQSQNLQVQRNRDRSISDLKQEFHHRAPSDFRIPSANFQIRSEFLQPRSHQNRSENKEEIKNVGHLSTQEINEVITRLHYLVDEGCFDSYFDEFVDLVFPIDRLITSSNESFIHVLLMELFVSGLQEENQLYVLQSAPSDLLHAMNLATYFEDEVKHGQKDLEAKTISRICEEEVMQVDEDEVDNEVVDEEDEGYDSQDDLEGEFDVEDDLELKLKRTGNYVMPMVMVIVMDMERKIMAQHTKAIHLPEVQGIGEKIDVAEVDRDPFQSVEALPRSKEILNTLRPPPEPPPKPPWLSTRGSTCWVVTKIMAFIHGLQKKGLKPQISLIEHLAGFLKTKEKEEEKHFAAFSQTVGGQLTNEHRQGKIAAANPKIPPKQPPEPPLLPPHHLRHIKIRRGDKGGEDEERVLFTKVTGYHCRSQLRSTTANPGSNFAAATSSYRGRLAAVEGTLENFLAIRGRDFWLRSRVEIDFGQDDLIDSSLYFYPNPSITAFSIAVCFLQPFIIHQVGQARPHHVKKPTRPRHNKEKKQNMLATEIRRQIETQAKLYK